LETVSCDRGVHWKPSEARRLIRVCLYGDLFKWGPETVAKMRVDKLFLYVREAMEFVKERDALTGAGRR